LSKYEFEVLAFEPDAVFFVAHHLEESNLVRNLANRMRSGVEMPYDYLDEVARKAGIEENMTQIEAERLLRPFGPELVTWTYKRVVEVSKERGILPVWIFISALDESEIQDPTDLMRLAQEVGFTTIDLSDVYNGYNMETLIVAEWDRHPNAKGHRLMADRLFTDISERVPELSVKFP
jgi:hypothetical protein